MKLIDTSDLQFWADKPSFDGYLAIYVIDCLIVYATKKENPNRKINLAIDLLFNP